jgi:programmed cell death protein 5
VETSIGHATIANVSKQIRKARLQQLKEQSGGGQGDDPAQQKQYVNQSLDFFVDTNKSNRDAEAQQKESILAQILTPEAADRLGRIRLVKASRADAVESRLVSLARSGQIRQKVGEEELKGFLEKVSENENQQKGGKIEVVRRGGWDDDDDLEAMLND